MTARDRRRWLRPLLVGLAVLLVAAVAAAANMALLDAAGEDRLGHLRPVDPALGRTAGTAASGATTAAGPAAAPSTTQSRSTTEAGATTGAGSAVTDDDDRSGPSDDEPDDDRGRGRGRGRGGDDDD